MFPQSILLAQNQISPSGDQIVSYEKVKDQTDIYIQSWDGEKNFITSHAHFDYNPQWSSDGKSIVFYRKHPVENKSSIILYSLTEDNEDEILNGGFYDGDPSLSHDSRFVAFTSDRDGNYDIYKFNRSTNEVISLVSNESNNYGPS